MQARVKNIKPSREKYQDNYFFVLQTSLNCTEEYFINTDKLKVAPSLNSLVFNLDTIACLNNTKESSFRNCMHILHVHCKHQLFTSSFEGGNNQHFTIAHVQDLFNKKYS